MLSADTVRQLTAVSSPSLGIPIRPQLQFDDDVRPVAIRDDVLTLTQ